MEHAPMLALWIAAIVGVAAALTTAKRHAFWLTFSAAATTAAILVTNATGGAA